MLISTNLRRNLIVISFILIGLNISKAEEPNDNSKILEYLTASPEFSSEGTIAVADSLGFQNWPKTNIWRVAPDINKLMLIHPDKITRDDKSYHLISLSHDYWASCDWRAYHVIENNEPVPEFPEEVTNKLVQNLAPEFRNNPEFVKKYKDDLMDRYRKSHKYRNSGTLMVKIYNMPNSKAAHECLLINITNTSMLSQGVIMNYLNAEKMNDLGTMSYVRRNANNTFIHIDFIRDNIYVTIEAEGEFSDEALQLAKKIDSAIVKSPALTYEQLISRRPSLAIGSEIIKETVLNLKQVTYSISAPNDVNIVYLEIEGEGRGFHNGRIILPKKSGPADIKLLAITNELLAEQCEKTIEISDVNNGKREGK